MATRWWGSSAGGDLPGSSSNVPGSNSDVYRW